MFNTSEIELLLRKLYQNELTLQEARKIVQYIIHLETCLELVPAEKRSKKKYED